MTTNTTHPINFVSLLDAMLENLALSLRISPFGKCTRQNGEYVILGGKELLTRRPLLTQP
jgi:hypothetical protein